MTFLGFSNDAQRAADMAGKSGLTSSSPTYGDGCGCECECDFGCGCGCQCVGVSVDVCGVCASVCVSGGGEFVWVCVWGG